MNIKMKQELLLMVRALYFCLEEQWSNLAKKHDISPAQQHILFLLSTNNKTLTPTVISELGCWHLSTVTRLLKPLQAKRFISISINPKKKKQKQVCITEKGEQLLSKLAHSAAEDEFFPLQVNHLTEDEINCFFKSGKKILHRHKGEQFNEKVLNARIDGFDYS